MAIALAAALPALQQMNPNQALEFIEAAERAAVKARSISWQMIHSSGLTAEEQYQGWLPLIIIMYRLWQKFLEPQIAFGLETQIGVAQVMNRFGANIDTSQLQSILSKVKSTVDIGKHPQGAKKGPSGSIPLGNASTGPEVWEVTA